jgi:hypothetical protein
MEWELKDGRTVLDTYSAIARLTHDRRKEAISILEHWNIATVGHASCIRINFRKVPVYCELTVCCNVEGETKWSYEKLPNASPTRILRLWRGCWKPQNFESRSRHDSKHSSVQAVFGPWKWDRLVVPKRRAETTILRCIKFQRSAMSSPRQKPEITQAIFLL